MYFRQIHRFTGIAILALGFAGAPVAKGQDLTKVQGPNACSECHKDESAAWQESHHFKTFREMPRNPKGKEIAQRMGIRRIKSEGLCLSCHFTVQQTKNKPKVVAGIACESCHGAGGDWIKVHSGFSGKTEATETPAEEAARWAQSDQLGMIRTASIYRIAKNCFSCHVVPQEDLVNVGGHSIGSQFDLVSWSQGEVRHNTWYSKGASNQEADVNRKRILYVIGLAVEIETALRSIAKANARKLYAFKMAQRADVARKKLAQAASAVPNVPELAKIVQLSHTAGLKLNNAAALNAAAESIAQISVGFTSKYDGSQLAGIDGLIPGPQTYKGAARQ
ncbi:MAG: cytochrome c family protein [Hyphomicrobiales bacterium]|nr:cytochrome c family protein [Hyphomicrobiales bacterium]